MTRPPRHLSRRQALGRLALGATAATAAGLAGSSGLLDVPAAAADDGTAIRPWNYPRGLRPSYQYALDAPAMNLAEHTLAATLQGQLSARRPPSGEGPVVHIWSDSTAYGTWLEDFRTTYGIPTRHLGIWDLAALLAKPGSHGAPLDHYILCRIGDSSLNVANSLAALTGAVVVDESIEPKVAALGLRRSFDARGKDDRWLLANHGHRFNPRLAIEQETVTRTSPLRDYSIVSRAFTFFDGVTDFRREVLSGLAPDASVLGWGPGDVGEDVFVSQASRAGVLTVPADWALNLSVYSAMDAGRLRQKARPPLPAPDPDKHYVAFQYTDGDNLQMAVGSLQNTPGWWANPNRGTFDIGWALPPSILELAPTVVKYLYDDASTNGHYDRFVAGPSGGGYLYPSLYPAAALDAHTGRLAQAMAGLDMDVTQIIDFESFDDTRLWSKYLRHEQIKGLIYLEYSHYAARDGQVRWANGKPIVSIRQNLWGLQDGSEEPDVIAKLNRQAPDPSSPRGYSIVSVHNWSKGVDQIKTVVDALGPHIQVVTPDVIVKMIARYVRPTS